MNDAHIIWPLPTTFRCLSREEIEKVVAELSSRLNGPLSAEEPWSNGWIARRIRDMAAELVHLRKQRDELQTAGTRLVEQRRELKRQIAMQSSSNRERNIALDALHYVWCSGGCDSGVHRYDGQGPAAITEEIVKAAIRNTERLVEWFGKYEWKKAWSHQTPDVKEAYSRALADAAEARRQATAAAMRAHEVEELFASASESRDSLVACCEATCRGRAPDLPTLAERYDDALRRAAAAEQRAVDAEAALAHLRAEAAR